MELEEEGCWQTEKAEVIAMNDHVVRLIQEKLIPLNRSRHDHLQKITHALRQPPALIPRLPLANLQQRTKTERSSDSRMVTADLLLNRLKQWKDLPLPARLTHEGQRAGQCWQTLRSTIKPQIHLATDPTDRSKLGSRSRKRGENLIQIAERAEKYLRSKKHDLKEQYCREQQWREGRRKQPKPTEIQQLLSKFRGRVRGGSEQQMQRELLRDIRENMLQERINRIKKDINHKKIVQMR